MKNYLNAETSEDDLIRMNESDVVYALRNQTVNTTTLISLKNQYNIRGENLSKWLHITPKTLRSYMSQRSVLSDGIGEQIILLSALFHHGSSVFGSVAGFDAWLNNEHPLLDGVKPMELLGSVSGIRLVDNRLFGIEYGDNA